MKYFLIVVFLFLLFIGSTANAQDQDICIRVSVPDGVVERIDCPTSTPIPTETAVPTPTQEVIKTPFPTSIPSTKVCKLRPLFDVKVRQGPGITFPQITESNNRIWKQGVEQTFVEFNNEDRNYLWGRSEFGWSAIRDKPLDEWWVAGVEFYSTICPRVDGWPADLVPPEAFAAWIPPENPRGIEINPGSQCDAVILHISDYGTIKGITGTHDCIITLRSYFPNLMLVWRNWIRGWHIGDGPADWGKGDPIAVARDWWNEEYVTWKILGLIQSDRSQFKNDVVDFFEYRNELLFVGEWEVQFDLEILRLANEANVCLAVFSDGYGNPQLAEFNQRFPVLDYMVEKECQPGKHHVIAAHIYSRYDSGKWLFDRWQLQREWLRSAYGDKYDSLYWVFTELGVPNDQGEYTGRGNPDCIRAYQELNIIDDIFKSHKEVIGYHIFAMGIGWLDWSRCL